MMLACPGCGTVYEVAPARLGARPRLVRCSACGTKWRYPPNATQAELQTSDTPTGELEQGSEPAGDAGQRPAAAGMGKPTAAAPIDGEADEALGPASEPTADEADDASPAPSPALAPAAGPPAEPAPAAADRDAAAAAAPEKLRPTLRQRLQLRPGWAAAVSAMATAAGVLSLLLVLRGAVIAAIPFSAGFYGLFGLLPDGPGAGLRIQEITSTRQFRDGSDVLTVSGVVANIVNEPAVVPTIWITVLDAEDAELQSVSLDNQRASLAAGQKFAFDKDIPNPGPRARRVRVSFMTAPQPSPE